MNNDQALAALVVGLIGLSAYFLHSRREGRPLTPEQREQVQNIAQTEIFRDRVSTVNRRLDGVKAGQDALAEEHGFSFGPENKEG